MANTKLAGGTTEEALAKLSLSQGLSDVDMDITRLAGEALLLNRPLASLLLSERVCPICVVQHLAGERNNVKLTMEQKPYEGAEALKSLILTSESGALEAMAAAHNQEMHAMNGNINFSVTHDTSRADVMAAALTRATRGVRHRHANQVETERRLRVAQEEVPMLVYTSNVANGVGLVSAPPTRHQIFWFYGTSAQPAPAGATPTHASGCGEPSDGLPTRSVLETTGTVLPPPPSASSIWVTRMSRAWREWGLPLKGDVPRMARVVPELDDEWEVAAISTRHLDEVMHRQTRAVVLANGQTWCIDDPSVAVVVIDYASGNPQLMWALQLVLAAPYPLVEVDELFVVTGPEGAEASRLTAMRRNECCVTIDNRRRKFLIVTATGESVMQIAGVEVHVAGLDRNREPEQIFSQPIGEMLTACLDRILRSPTPLKVTMEQCLSIRMTAPNVDWALIDEIVAWLTMRFVPQPEVFRDEAGGSETHWLPRAYCGVAYATHALPECVAPEDESAFYYHDHATTFTDNVFVSRALANTAPALRVGAWTNEAELVTGLGIATYVHSERGTASSEKGTAMALDEVERAMLKRRLYEEWKRGVGISDRAVSPELMGNDRAFWDTIVYGAGEESDAVSAIGEASTSVGTSTAHLHSRLTIGSLRARPGKGGQSGPDATDPSGFQGVAPTSSPDVPTAPGGVVNVGAALTPPTTKPGASVEMAERNADHVAAQDA
ncbi:unnamed protein product [Arctia plantaginis]|uniref:Uncharacterized protein n=1 Tax=Arctia plantaginis TaxID=874455 RepID=A0A8S1ABI1_ARCPL|nr:unnamed protein product [Arctia plantaginis]